MSNPVGRPSKLNDELMKKAYAYIYCVGEQAQWAARGNVIPTLEDFALYLHISRETIYAWEKENEEFSDIVEAIRQDQANGLINGALSGKLNVTIAKLILSGKHGYVEQTNQNLKLANDPDNPVTTPLSQDLIQDFISTVKDATKQK